jgi:RND superfamily putative drug exporter
MLAGQSTLTQMGFAISSGIAISAFVMAMFFTPALTASLGRAAWWPGRADAAGRAPSSAQEMQSPQSQSQELGQIRS